MSDKVTGLQGAHMRIVQQVASVREETNVALTATQRDTLTKMHSLVESERSDDPLGPMLRIHQAGFAPPPPARLPERPRPRTASIVGSRGSGPVVLKDSTASFGPGSGSGSVGGEGARRGSVASSAGSGAADPGSRLAGPAGGALSPRSPRQMGQGWPGPPKVDRQVDRPPIDQRPSTAPFKTETERRKHILDRKRADLVDSRLRTQPAEGSSSGSSPRERMGSARSPLRRSERAGSPQRCIERPQDPSGGAEVGVPDPRLGISQPIRNAQARDA
uniref:Uncharacterized protein n=1 Tax=Haptolina ericina TaxID=156174 RepID=A0A7S3BWE7_9EUKA|mmetsp:Transcript_69629/g.155193  ORF Transcript_69629/g.155193 Transcript_69629/m.155193 type:complete len:275 (+) Transcript_69629:3-827(+)